VEVLLCAAKTIKNASPNSLQYNKLSVHGNSLRYRLPRRYASTIAFGSINGQNHTSGDKEYTQ